MKDNERNGERELGSLSAFSDIDPFAYDDGDDDAIDISPKRKSRQSVTGGARRAAVDERSARPIRAQNNESVPASKTAARSHPAQPSKVSDPVDDEMAMMFAAMAQFNDDEPEIPQAATKKAAEVQDIDEYIVTDASEEEEPAPAKSTSPTRPATKPTGSAPVQSARPAARTAGSATARSIPGARPQGTTTAQNAARPATRPQKTAPTQGTPRPASRPQGASPSQGTSTRPATRTQGAAPVQGTPATTRPAARPQGSTTSQASAARPAPHPQGSTQGTRPQAGGSRPVSRTVPTARPAQNPAAAAPARIAPEPRARAERSLTAGCIVRRSLLVFFTTLFFVVGVLLAVCNTLANGPSQTARDKAVMSALQASATKWVPGLFLSDETVEQIKADSQVVNTDVKPITSVGDGEGPDKGEEDRWANAIDGMIYENVNGATFKGYVLLIKDPSRVSVAISSNDFKNATMGKRIFEIADEYNAVAAINAGEFRDDGGVGTGYAPMGLTYSEGECVWNDGLSRTFMGFDENNKLFVGEGTTYAQAEELGIRDAVSFQTGNVLITNDGENVTYYYADSNTGVAQRTAIGQCADGTVIFLVTDGRTASSMGATRNDIIDTLASYGAVTAGMLDGGSSSMLYYRDYYEKYDIDKSLLDEYQLMGLVNKYKAFTNPRRIPTFFIVNP